MIWRLEVWDGSIGVRKQDQGSGVLVGVKDLH